MNLAEALGYLASLLVFMTFYMKTMVSLRLVAIASNIAFIGYGYAESLYPVLILHVALLPLNIHRLKHVREIVSDDGHIQAHVSDFNALIPHMVHNRLDKGDVIFKRGDHADALYYVSKGRILLPEVGILVEEGGIVGEFGMFSPRREHAATAVCETDCEVYSLSAAKIQELCHHNPAFSHGLLHLITERFLQDLEKHPVEHAKQSRCGWVSEGVAIKWRMTGRGQQAGK